MAKFDFNATLVWKYPQEEGTHVRRAMDDVGYREELYSLIEASKKSSDIGLSASNAITILNAAREDFSGKDFSCVRVPGADLSLGKFNGTNFSNADLRGVKFNNASLVRANLTNANLGRLLISNEGRVQSVATVTMFHQPASSYQQPLLRHEHRVTVERGCCSLL